MDLVEAPSKGPSIGPPVTGGSAWCFLCGKRVGSSTRSSCNIFVVNNASSRQPMASCIAATLHTELSENTIASPLICKACSKTVAGIDDLEVQLAELREELVTKHRRTMRLLQAGELPPTDAATAIATGSSEERHARKTKQTPKVDVTEMMDHEDAVVDTKDDVTLEAEKTDTAEQKVEVKSEKRSRGRPSTKKKPKGVIAEVDEPLKNVEEGPTAAEIEKTETELEEGVGDEAYEPVEEELDEAEKSEFVDSDDPDFEPSKENVVVAKPKKVPSRVKKERKVRPPGDAPTAKENNAAPKKRGRPRSIINLLPDEDAGEITFSDAEEADANDPNAVFSCTSCEAKFSVAGALIAHLHRKHNITVLMCDLCGLDFESKEELKNHMDCEHPPDEPKPEPDEPQEFDPELDAEGDFQCEICNKLFFSLRLLREHKRTHYGRNFICDICHKRFSSHTLLEDHLNLHTGDRPFECGTCGKTFASKYCMKVHVKIHEVRPRPFSCDSCGKTFMKQEHLNQHVKTHQAHKNFICGTCGKAFSSSRNLEVHAVVHTGFKPFVCRTCGKAFARRAEIMDHERTHTGERPFQCETCGATFSQRSNLQSHKRATHLDDRRFVCQLCGKSFKRRRLLDYHTRSVHTGERPYACSECNATFVYPEHFKKHRRIHTGEKPFRCEVCGKAFNSRDNRNAHRFIHSNKKPYECLVCGLGFMRKPLLYTHMQAQGHVHDTIVVNQPQVSQPPSNVVSEAAAAAGISADKVYVSTTDDPEPDHQEEVEHILIDGSVPVHFEEGEEEEQARPTAILVPVSSGEPGSKEGTVQLVEIRLQGPPGEQPQWINLAP